LYVVTTDNSAAAPGLFYTHLHNTIGRRSDIETPLTPHELHLFSHILWQLGSGQGSRTLRQETLENVCALLQADFAASCIWSSLSNTSRHGVSWNIDDKAMREHASTWQYIDPITPLLRAKQRPTLVDEVMPARELYKTPFYQHFLKPCGMHHGVNVYFIREGEDVGDLRIWRAKGAPPFGQRELALLQLLEPWFARALPKDDASPALTAREQEVVNLVSKGLGDKEVARLLNISFTTVRTHLNHALKKLDCANRTELASRFRH